MGGSIEANTRYSWEAQLNYRDQYNDYAKQKARYYLHDKFSTSTTWGFRNHVRESVVIKLVENIKFKNLIDIGCASGHTLFKLASLFPQANFTGIDTGEQFIDVAQDNAKLNHVNNIRFDCNLVEDHNYKDKFDVVILLEVLEHIMDEKILVESIKSLLSKHGVVIISTPNLNGDGSIYGRFLRTIKLRKFIPAFDFSNEGTKKHGDQHVREFDHDKLDKLMSQNGFNKVQLTGVLFLDFPFQDFLYKIIRRIPLLLEFYIKFEIFLALRCNLISSLFSRHLIYVGKLNDSRNSEQS